MPSGRWPSHATAPTAQLCWTLGITEHHTASDNVLALISLALLTGHVGRYGSGLVPIRGQNNVQGGGDMGALPNRLPGFYDVEDPEARAKFEAAWNASIPPKRGWHLTQMFEAMAAGKLRGLYVIGENPAQSEADAVHAVEALRSLDFLVVQDIFMTATAELADVVFPAAADWVEGEGTVTSSERRVQRVRPALRPPGEARTDIAIISGLARAMGVDWGDPTAEEIWDELRSLSPAHAGMSYRRLEELGGIQWPCPDENHPAPVLTPGWGEEVRPGPTIPVDWVPPVDTATVPPATGRHPTATTPGRRAASTHSGRARPRHLPRAGAVGYRRQEVVRPFRRATSRPVRIDPRCVPAGVHGHPLPGRWTSSKLTIGPGTPNPARRSSTAVRSGCDEAER